MLQVTIVSKIKTRILCSIIFFTKNAVYEIMSKNMVGPEGPQRFTCWITWAADIHTEYEIPIAFPQNNFM